MNFELLKCPPRDRNHRVTCKADEPEELEMPVRSIAPNTLQPYNPSMIAVSYTTFNPSLLQFNLSGDCPTYGNCEAHDGAALPYAWPLPFSEDAPSNVSALARQQDTSQIISASISHNKPLEVCCSHAHTENFDLVKDVGSGFPGSNACYVDCSGGIAQELDFSVHPESEFKSFQLAPINASTFNTCSERSSWKDTPGSSAPDAHTSPGHCSERWLGMLDAKNIAAEVIGANPYMINTPGFTHLDVNNVPDDLNSIASRVSDPSWPSSTFNGVEPALENQSTSIPDVHICPVCKRFSGPVKDLRLDPIDLVNTSGKLIAPGSTCDVTSDGTDVHLWDVIGALAPREISNVIARLSTRRRRKDAASAPSL
ncbi:hypothetical protein K456DRAFT_38905 [Colletotrichum gloeosporioides 23]|nr:hypothetical protein K456DRAFT_38905 [Colletotrichum gloeosporioides 23]